MNGTKIIKIKLDEEIPILEKPDKPVPRNGIWSFIYDGQAVDKIANLYGRNKCCFKIFKIPLKCKPKEYFWGTHLGRKGTVWDATVAQNICSLDDLAPRVYALFTFEQNEKKYLAQLTEDLGPHTFTRNKQQEKEITNSYMARILSVCKKHKIDVFEDRRDKNIVKDKWVDFQGFSFESDYQQDLIKRIDTIANWHPPRSYQTIDAVDLKGRRDTQDRISKLGLDKIDFKGKTVLDIGCSAGTFCHYAVNKGAKRVVGFDLPERAKIAAELAYHLGYFNIDYHSVDLKKETYESLVKKTKINQYDIVLYLSMAYHIGYPDYIPKLCKDLLVYEGNARINDGYYTSRMENDFRKLNRIGHTDDLSKRPVVWLRK